MGQQQSSKSHAPLTFGYINNTQHGNEEENEYFDRDRTSPDFVLDNPHLYQLESTCQHCSSKTHYPMIVAEQTNTLCKHCRQNKRLSLVRRDLANDLNYIDETYYPNIVHYEEDEEENELDIASTSASSAPMNNANTANTDVPDASDTDNNNNNIMSDEDEDDTNTLRDEEGWSKLTIGEITPTIPKRLVSSPSLAVDLSGKSLIKLSSSIGYLDNLTKLDLSDNQMINLPRAIGRLKNLRIFNASKNQLETIPDTITSMGKLKAINLSHNKLTALPKGIGSLPSLIILIINHNQLAQLPRELSNLNDLITLNVSHNPLKTIPAEISALKSLRKLTAEECAFDNEIIHTLAHDPPSLFEICARNMVRSNISLPPSLSHHHIADYFKQEQACSFCFGPYFESFVSRSRFIERTGRQIIALDYKLCCAHWTDENDRISAMFSTPYYKQQPYLTNGTSTSIPVAQTQQPLIETEGLSIPSSPISDEDLPQQDYFNHNQKGLLLSANSSEDILYLPTNTENEAFASSSSSAALPIATSFSQPSSLSLLEAPSKPTSTTLSNSLRPRSSSTSLLRISAMHNHHQHQNISTILLQQQENTTLPFATLSGRQSEEADIILSRQQQRNDDVNNSQQQQQQQQQQQTKKSNGFKQGFAQLGARLGRKGGSANNQRDGSGSSNGGNRDRSETV